MGDIVTYLIDIILGLLKDPLAQVIIAIILFILIILMGLSQALPIISSIINVIKTIWTRIFREEQRDKILFRQQFAKTIQLQIQNLNNREDWNDNRFTDLEAEVETEGETRVFKYLPFIEWTKTRRRTEPSLSIALERVKDHIIVLEGDPGSGKSVALRHVALRMAERASKSTSLASIIPVYVNLKEIKRDPAVPVNRDLIAKFIFASLTRSSHRDFDAYLEENFNQGLRNGSWFFLFDSFDEIPDILSSTHADEIIQEYSNALVDFLSTLNECRGIIASRYYRGPRKYGWTRFSILNLSRSRQHILIKRAIHNRSLRNKIIGDLENASSSILSLIKNPMFLSLLCVHVNKHENLPTNSHEVYEDYLQERFNRDRERLEKKFGVLTSEAQIMAEQVAFCMIAEKSLGLSAQRDQIREAMNRQGFDVTPRFEVILDALEYIKIARGDTPVEPEQTNNFTFSHRRFQEYFATNVVLRDPQRVPANKLLFDARWRETAVVIFQTRQHPLVTVLLNEAQNVLQNLSLEIDPTTIHPLIFVETHSSSEAINAIEKVQINESWSQELMHLFGLLQEGLLPRLISIPTNLQFYLDFILLNRYVTGPRYEKLDILEVAGVVNPAILTWMVKHAFSTSSMLLQQAAYHQVARLAELSSEIVNAIAKWILRMHIEKRLRKNQYEVKAYLARLTSHREFINLVNNLIYSSSLLLFALDVLDKISSDTGDLTDDFFNGLVGIV